MVVGSWFNNITKNIYDDKVQYWSDGKQVVVNIFLTKSQIGTKIGNNKIYWLDEK